MLYPKEAVRDLKGPFNKIVPDSSPLLCRFKKELVEPAVFTGNTKEEITQTESQPQSDRFSIDRRRDPFHNIGHSDVDHLGPGNDGIQFNRLSHYFRSKILPPVWSIPPEIWPPPPRVGFDQYGQPRT